MAPKRHPHANLVDAASGIIGRNPVEADRSQDQGKHSEERSESRDEPLLSELAATCSLNVRIETIGILGSTEAIAWRTSATDRLAPGLVRMTISRRKSEPRLLFV